MKNDIANKKEMQVDVPVVIADECGDSMWDAVLGQEVKACDISAVFQSPNAMPGKPVTVEVEKNENAK